MNPSTAKFSNKPQLQTRWTHTTEKNGTLFSIGCYAAAIPPIRTLGLSRRSRVVLLPVWRTIWRATQLCAVKLQLQGPQHGKGTYRLLQSQACTRFVSNSESCCRLVSKLSHRSKVLQPLHYCCFDTALTTLVRNCQLHVDHCSPRTYLGHSMAEVKCACWAGKASAKTEQNAQARRHSLPPRPAQGMTRWRYHRCPIRPPSLSQPTSSLHR